MLAELERGKGVDYNLSAAFLLRGISHFLTLEMIPPESAPLACRRLAADSKGP